MASYAWYNMNRAGIPTTVTTCRRDEQADGMQRDTFMSRQSDPIDVDQLSVAERILVVQRIWDSLADQEASIPITDAQREELDRRLEGHSNRPAEGATWDEVQSRLRANPS
jgi:putative addiction module component (TIGR02574 family)